MFISIIIPSYNEAAHIAHTVQHLLQSLPKHAGEVLVVDAGSIDDTVALAEAAGAEVMISPGKGRSRQMNHAAKHAKGDVLYFVHADTRPPSSYFNLIENCLNNGENCGSFRTKFDNSSFLLGINAFFTRFNFLFFRGGDQSIFICRKLWEKIGPYDESMMVMEDYELLRKLWNHGKFKLLNHSTLVSARKYEHNSWLRVQLANLKVVKMYKRGASQVDMIETYSKMLNYRKNAF